MMKSVLALWNSANKRAIFMIAMLLGIWIVFNYFSGGYILRAENMANLFRQVTVVALLSIGMTLVIVSGNIDLSVGAALGMFGAFAAAMMTQMGVNSCVTVIIVLMLGLLAGCMHGVLVHYFNVPSFVATLGGLIAYRGITQWVARESIPIRAAWVKAIAVKCLPNGISFTVATMVVCALIIAAMRRRNGLRKAGLTSGPLWIDLIKLAAIIAGIVVFVVVMAYGGGVPIQVVIMLAAAVIFSLMAKYTRFGHYVYAIGGNKQAALYSGVPIASNIIGVFGLMGMLAAAAGIVTVSELSSAAADVGELKELEAIAACVIGGSSLMGGSGVIGMSILGALVMAS
ncbi:MAG: hypothetical protein PHC61_18400, partial [Chitinivibrionales bacterium]|nr:hypothetical protein [Chitinivibrionales bacterium]